MNDLTVSNIERQNVLNNRYALQTIQENLAVDGLRYHDELLFTTKMVADFYGVDERTINVIYKIMVTNFVLMDIF